MHADKKAGEASTGTPHGYGNNSEVKPGRLCMAILHCDGGKLNSHNDLNALASIPQHGSPFVLPSSLRHLPSAPVQEGFIWVIDQSVQHAREVLDATNAYTIDNGSEGEERR